MMHALGDREPAWCRRYVPVPVAEGGRTMEGVDCWGLVCLIYREQWGVPLSGYEGLYELDAAPEIEGLVDQELGRGVWQPIPVPGRVGDVGLFAIQGYRMHVGVALTRSKMLHALSSTGVSVERFDSPFWSPRLRGWYRYAGPVRLTVKPSPFRTERVDTEIPAGKTVAECREIAGLPDLPGLRALIDGREVPRSAWHRVRPRPGRQLAFAVLPEGGDSGKTIVRVILTIAIVAAAIYTGGAVAGAYYAAGTAGYSVVSGVTAAGITIAGTLLVNALIPLAGQRLSDNGDQRGSSSISGARNEARPFGPLNEVFGRHRLAPPYAAQPYTEIVGDDQYLRCLFDVGTGPLALSEFKIGDTPIEDYEGVEIEIREGEPTDEPLTLFANSVLEDAVGAVVAASADWISRTSAVKAEELSLDITFPQGLAEYATDGSRRTREVAFEIEYREVGGSWQRIDGASPNTARQLAYAFRLPEVERGGSDSHAGLVQWSADGSIAGAKPAYLPESNYSWEADGYLRFDQDGDYEFAVDGAGAIELQVGGKVVASWYGDHPPDGAGGVPSFGAHAGTVRLGRGWNATQGWVRIRVRMASRPAGGAVAIGWRGPGIPAWESIPADRLRRFPDGIQGLAVRWFRLDGYTSTPAIAEASSSPIRRTYAWAVSTGQYEVRVRRLTPDAESDRIIDTMYWSALRTFRSENPVQRPNRALLALRIKATGQLNGVLDSFNLVAHSILPDWDADAGEWVVRPTSSPAAAYRAVLQSPRAARPLADERLHLEEIQEWAAACQELGLEFNAVVDFAGTVYERLRDICAAGRATFTMRDSRYSVVRDRIHTTPVQLFTPRNTNGFRGSIAFPEPPHAVKVWFINSETGYQRDVRVVYDDGYSARGELPETQAATRFETIELFGVTSAAEAWKHGRYYLAAAQLRPEVYEIGVDFEHLIAQHGDMVLLQNDVPLLGQAAGRVTALGENSNGDLATITIDEPVAMDAAFDYGIRIRKTDRTIIHSRVVAESAEGITTLILDPPRPPSMPRPEVGDLWAFGRFGTEVRECIVKAVIPGPDLSARLQLVDHAPSVHNADRGQIPDYDPGIERPPVYAQGPAAPVVLTIQSDDLVMARDADGSLRARMLLTYQIPASRREAATHVQVRTREMPADGTEPVGPFTFHPVVPADNSRVFVDGVEEGRRYQIRIRSVASNGRASAWVDRWTPTPPDPDADGTEQPLEHTIIGKVRPPPDVEAFDVIRTADGTRRYTWTLGVVPPDIAGVLVRFGPGGRGLAWEQLTALHDGILEGASPVELNIPPAGTWTFGIKMIDTSGNESVNALLIDRTLGAPRQEGVVVSADAFAERWPGGKVGCYRSNDGTLVARGRETWADLTTWEVWSSWTLSPESPIRYTHPVIDAGFLFDCEPAAVVASNATNLIEFRYSADNVIFTEWQPLDDAAGLTVRGRYFQFRLTCTTNYPTVAQVTTFLMMLRARTVEHVINDLATSSLTGSSRIGPGDVRLPIPTALMGVVRAVSVSFNGTGAGWTWEVVDRSSAPGPRVRLYNPSGELADATIDAVVRGLELTGA